MNYSLSWAFLMEKQKNKRTLKEMDEVLIFSNRVKIQQLLDILTPFKEWGIPNSQRYMKIASSMNKILQLFKLEAIRFDSQSSASATALELIHIDLPEIKQPYNPIGTDVYGIIAYLIEPNNRYEMLAHMRFDGIHYRNLATDEILFLGNSFEFGCIFEIGRIIKAKNISFTSSRIEYKH